MASSDLGLPLTVIVPGEPDQNTGGYRYVRLLAKALNEHGTRVRVIGLAGQFPRPDEEAMTSMDQTLARCPDGAGVVLDGLAMGAMPSVVERHVERLNLVALVHHPLADETGLDESERRWLFAMEQRALAAVGRVITTSHFTAARLADFGVGAQSIRTVEPGVSAKASVQAPGRRSPAQAPELLCVAHLSPRKAQAQLVQALAGLKTLPWNCTLAGALDRDPAYSQTVRALIQSHGLQHRIRMTGEVTETQLAELYDAADLFVLPSLYEGYGMVVDEALASGLPVISSNGGALVHTGARPAVLQYPAGDLDALAAGIQRWLADPEELAIQTRLARKQAKRTRSWGQAATEMLAALDYFRESRRSTFFDRSWLQLREPADHAARSQALTQSLDRWVRHTHANASQDAPVLVVDLGAGQGSNVGYLSSRLGVPQRWLLLDQDSALLGCARLRLAPLQVPLSTIEARLTAASLDSNLPRDAAVVTASALIDLVSDSWLEALTVAVVSRHAALLVVLSYAGRFDVSPPDERDSQLQDLVNQHQHGDKGLGEALGPAATSVLECRMRDAGYTVAIDHSPWRLDGTNSELIVQLLDGWVQAAVEQSPSERGWLQQWLADRKRQLAVGALSVQVDHLDLLALPGEAPA